MRVGIDIGGTKTEAVALDETGRVVATARLATGFGADEVIDTAMAALDRVGALHGVGSGGVAGGAGSSGVGSAGPSGAGSSGVGSAGAGSAGLGGAGVAIASAADPLRSVGVGIPGAVDARTGRVEHAVNLGLVGLELGAALEERIGLPVRVENDVNAAALGAFARLGFASDDSMAYLNLGTGLAAGLVLGGRLWRGSHGVAGEIGHIPVDPQGELCRCGQRGCLELSASGSAVARAWPVDDGWPVRDLFDSAAAGDARALAVRDGFADRVASAVRILVLTVDVQHIVIGGGLSSLGDELLSAVRSALEAQAASSPFLASQGLTDRVRLAPNDVPISAVGAALAGEA